MCLGVGVLCAAGVLILSATVLQGFADRGLLLIVPWLIPTLLQDYWRNLLFREKRASAAAANDGVWLVIMVLTLPIVWRWPSDWAVMASWGGGASAGAIFGFFQNRIFPAPLGDSWRWFRKHAWPFGKWNAGAGILDSIGTLLRTFAVVGILGAAALGGLGAAWTVFGPLSLIAPAISLPGLPAMARAHARGEGRRLAVELSMFTVVASAAYFLLLLLGGWKLLPLLYGESFARYRGLIWPVTAAQVFSAVEVGALLLIKAQQRGGVLVFTQALASVVGLVLTVVLSLEYGLTGAAWTLAVMCLLSMSLLSVAALRGPRSAGLNEGTVGRDLTTALPDIGDSLIGGGGAL